LKKINFVKIRVNLWLFKAFKLLHNRFIGNNSQRKSVRELVI